MTEITLSIKKEAVYKEVAKTAEYTGDKMQDADGYDNMQTTDEDKEMLERFWQESINLVCDNLKKVLLEGKEMDVEEPAFPEKPQPDEGGTRPPKPPTISVRCFRMKLGLSTSFDSALQGSMESSLFSYFVNSILSKWFGFMNKDESAEYASAALACAEDVKRKAFYKKRPTRPSYPAAPEPETGGEPTP